MANYRTSQYQDGNKVLKCREWRCQGTKRRFKKPEHTKEHIEKDSNKYFVKNLENSELKPNLRSKLIWESGLFDGYDPG